MQGDVWRIVKRRPGIGGGLLQPMIERDGLFIPLGPWADDIEDMRRQLQEMLAACDEPVVDGREARIL